MRRSVTCPSNGASITVSSSTMRARSRSVDREIVRAARRFELLLGHEIHLEKRFAPLQLANLLLQLELGLTQLNALAIVLELRQDLSLLHPVALFDVNSLHAALHFRRRSPRGGPLPAPTRPGSTRRGGASRRPPARPARELPPVRRPSCPCLSSCFRRPLGRWNRGARSHRDGRGAPRYRRRGEARPEE